MVLFITQGESYPKIDEWVKFRWLLLRKENNLICENNRHH